MRREASSLGLLLPVAFTLLSFAASAQPWEHWSEQPRPLRYTPDRGDFVIVNGDKRFNRALYGSNSGFRVEAGDLPEFGLYMPRLGGTLRLGLIKGESSKWLIDAKHMEARYNAGSMRYEIADPLLTPGKLKLKLLALPDADGMILQVEGENIPPDTRLFWAFGGATDKRFSREGDLGADPESVFYLTADKCTGNEYKLQNNSFDLYYGAEAAGSGNEIYQNKNGSNAEELEASRLHSKKKLSGIITAGTSLKLADAGQQASPLAFFQSEVNEAPAVCGQLTLKTKQYLLLLNPDTGGKPSYTELPLIFEQAEAARQKLVKHFRLNTPDEYMNAAGGALATAADGIWDGQSYMHGAVAWRMPLNGWRGAYAADWLGWPERAKSHFRGYFAAQYTEPASGPSVPDSAAHLARQTEEVGTALFTDGYISRNPGKLNKPHHYDMNLVFISQLLWHFRWTGDTAFIRESWPVLERHLAWEKRNFDANDDGLYDAYCCIWASDALQYSGGSVTHSSAYNYRANSMAAKLAPIAGKNPTPYFVEAEKIKMAVNAQLWMAEKGWYAEYKDLLGLQQLHPSAAVWTVYHAIDEQLADPFQAWQSTEYLAREIPRIPIRIEGHAESDFYTMATSNWMPYTWSINNVALAEVLHTALAYWQSGRSAEAYQLTKASLLDYMFLGSSPGNFGQLSYYDTFRGELYRDFADPIGMASRVFVEGLFGVKPNLLHNEISLQPGWPASWNFAQLETPYLKIDFRRSGQNDSYQIENQFGRPLQLKLKLPARSAGIGSLRVNGQAAAWACDSSAIGSPVILITTPATTTYQVELVWEEASLEQITGSSAYAEGESLKLHSNYASILRVNDPQSVLGKLQTKAKQLEAMVQGETGGRSFFVQLQQGRLVWWQPIAFDLREPVDLEYAKNQRGNSLEFAIRNNTATDMAGTVLVNGFKQKLLVPAKSTSNSIKIATRYLVPGSNPVSFQSKAGSYTENIINWDLKVAGKLETIPLDAVFNDRVTHIFSEQYWSLRSQSPTLAIPVQGIGDWCSFRETEFIDDSGMRQAAEKGPIISPQEIPFRIPSNPSNNIVFTSQWDVYPDQISIPLSGKASHAYLLMAGTAHHMRVNLLNARVEVSYTDGSSEQLELRSPDNWWPIEQDYYEDGYAFHLPKAQPPRLYLHTGEWHTESYPVLKKNGTNKLEGGAASLLDLPLNPDKELNSLRLHTLSNDLVIGLMALTLRRK